MTNNYIEKEIKLKIDNPDIVISRLKKLKAHFTGQTFEKTIRFENKGSPLEKEGVFLRIKSGFKNKITVKKKDQTASKVLARTEVETGVEDVDKMRQILNILGFTKELIMEKYRQKWEFANAEITIDEMPFGFYVEIEGEEKAIWEVAKALMLDINRKITVTYWDLFEDYKKEKGLSGENIEFPQNYHPVLGN